MGTPAGTLVLYTIVIANIIENCLELYISWRQVRVYEKSRKVPAELRDFMSADIFEKSRLYGLDKERFSIFKGIIGLVIDTIELLVGLVTIIWGFSTHLVEKVGLDATSEIQISLMFVLVNAVIGTVKSTPLKFYSTFVIEERHGFNKQTVAFFFKDEIKSFFVFQLIGLPIISGIIWIVRNGGPYFFVWLWAFTGIVILIMLSIYPVFIAPLFDKYRPLDEGPLRKSIEALAQRLQFPLAQLYVVDKSKRSAHSNAYFYGLWGSKRIVLFDNLLINKGRPLDYVDEDAKETDPVAPETGKGCEDAEVLAVLGHELGHWKLGHITKNLIIAQVHTFIVFAAFSTVFRYGPLYQAMGFAKGVEPVLIGLLVVFEHVFAVFNAVTRFLMNCLSRLFEYQADAFASELGYTTELSKALVKLQADNLGFPVYDHVYSVWNHSHPTLLQRLERLNLAKKSD